MNTTSSSISNTFIDDKNLVIYNSGIAYIYLCDGKKTANITSICKDYSSDRSSGSFSFRWKLSLFLISNLFFCIF
jgi:hypothetical protein